MAQIYLSGWVGGVTMILRQSQFDLTSTGLLELSLAIFTDLIQHLWLILKDQLKFIIKSLIIFWPIKIQLEIAELAIASYS